jgi:osmoprotectant transport system substrate-binding protein
VKRLALFALALVLAGCGSDDGGHTTPAKPAVAQGPGAGKPPVVLGTKNFTEQYVLGQLYKQALEAQGFRVVLKNDIGASEIVDRVLTSGGIDMYPEYTGVIVQELAKEPKRPKTPEETYRRAKAFEAKRGFVVFKRSPGSDVLANGVRPAYARRHGLTTTSDLKKVGRFKYGGAPENRTRFQGAVGLEKVYGLNKLEYVPIKIEDRYDALESGQVDVVGVFSTEAQLTQKDKVVVLPDPKGIFGFQNIVPVVKESVAKAEGPAFEKTLNAVTAKLTDEELRKLNAEVDLKGKEPADVARAWLKAQGLT